MQRMRDAHFERPGLVVDDSELTRTMAQETSPRRGSGRSPPPPSTTAWPDRTRQVQVVLLDIELPAARAHARGARRDRGAHEFAREAPGASSSCSASTITPSSHGGARAAPRISSSSRTSPSDRRRRRACPRPQATGASSSASAGELADLKGGTLFLGASERMRKVREVIAAVAPPTPPSSSPARPAPERSSSPGPSLESPRAGGPMVAVNLAATPRELR